MSSQVTFAEAQRLVNYRAVRACAISLAAGFLALNMTVRGYSLHLGSTVSWASALFLGALAIGAVALVVRPGALAPLLTAFGASFLLYGFHAYRLASQVFELLLTMFALVLLLRLRGGAQEPRTRAAAIIFLLYALYALLAAGSLLLLPQTVLRHRLFLEGAGIGPAILAALPKDPLYTIASVNRLWLFGLFAWLLAAQHDSSSMLLALLRGIAWAALAASLLGLLDFAGVISLDRYNLSHLFYGAGYRRLQSTFGNPSWFACFVACAQPLVLLEFQQARGRARLALALAFPMCAASLFLSGARAAWLAGLVMLGGFGALTLALHRRGRTLGAPSAAGWLAFGGTLATCALLIATAASVPLTLVPGSDAPPSRLEGLSREIQYRGLGLQSPRRVAAAYAFQLARLAPWLGLGYESFNLHLRAQMEIPGTGVSSVVNTAVDKDVSEAVFDDSHNTYLQVLTGTGMVGLVVWLGLALVSGWAALRAFLCDPTPRALAVTLGLLLFAFYGLLQGMAYIPVTFFLFPLLASCAATLDASPVALGARRKLSALMLAGALVALLAAAAYAHDNGYAGLKRRFGVPAYLPDEAAEFEGFYRPEAGPAGEFRWMARRAIVNVWKAQPFTLRFTCEHPDAERDPVVLLLRFEGRDAGTIVFRRPGTVERRFAFDTPGALRLSVSRTFRPGGGDRRELGVAVSALRRE